MDSGEEQVQLLRQINSDGSAPLRESATSNVKIRNWQAISMLTTVCIGAGSLALPYAFDQAGVVGGVVGVVGVGLLSFLSCLLLQQSYAALLNGSGSSGGREWRPLSNPYAAVGHGAFGTWAVVVVNALFLVNVLGACVVFLIFIETTLAAVTDKVDEWVWVLVVLPVILPLAWTRELGIYAYTSLLGIASLVMGYTAVIVYGLMQYTPAIAKEDAFVKWETYAVFFGIIFFAFAMPFICLQVYSEMKNPSWYPKAVALAVTGVISIYLIEGLLGFAIFSQAEGGVNSNIILNLPEGSIASIVIQVAMCACILFTYPLAMMVAGGISDGIVISVLEDHCLHIPSERTFRLSKVGARTGMVFLTAIVAIFVPSFEGVINIIGSFSGSLICFFLPPLFYVRIFYGKLSRPVLAGNVLMALFGVFSCLLCTYFAIMQLIEEAQESDSDNPSSSSNSSSSSMSSGINMYW